MGEVLRQLKERGVPTFTYHLDLMLDLGREKELEEIGMMQIQHFFTVEGDFADWLNANTSVKGHYLPAGVILRDCFIAEPDQNFPYDVVFTGSYDYHATWPYRPKLLNFLRKTYGNKYHRWGHAGRDRFSSPYIMGADLNKIYSSAKVVVADTFCTDFNKPYYFSNRVFEQTGKGAFGDKKAFNVKTMLISIPQLGLPVALYWLGSHFVSASVGLAFVAGAGMIGFAFRNPVFQLIEKIYKSEKYATIDAYKQKG